jgi:hypothetical protein
LKGKCLLAHGAGEYGESSLRGNNDSAAFKHSLDKSGALRRQ